MKKKKLKSNQNAKKKIVELYQKNMPDRINPVAGYPAQL